MLPAFTPEVAGIRWFAATAVALRARRFRTLRLPAPRTQPPLLRPVPHWAHRGCTPPKKYAHRPEIPARIAEAPYKLTRFYIPAALL